MFYYRVDLRDLERPRGGRSHLTWWWLKVLVGRLPSDSATVTALRDSGALAHSPTGEPGSGPWSSESMLLALVVDALHTLAWMQSDRKSPRPEPVPRPGHVRSVELMPAWQVAHLEALRTGGG